MRFSHLVRRTIFTPPHEPSSMTRKTDPLVHSSIREAILVTGIWLAAAIWSISVCYAMGYHRAADDLKLVLGFPDWIFWGVVIPWTTCTVVSIVFGLIFVRDGDLGKDIEDADDLGLGG
jgi:hypothetical protein